MAPLLALLLLSLPAAPPSALDALADAVAAQVGPPAEGRRGLALALAAEPPALAAPLGAALTAALGRAGWAVTPVSPAGGETPARAAGADWLLSLTAGTGGRGPAELVAIGEAVALWDSFFLQARPGVRPAPPRTVSARAPADAAVELLLRPARRPDLARLALRRLARLPWRTVALAAGDAGEAGPSILAVTPDAVRLLDAGGAEVASRPLDPAARRPVRQPLATAVVADLGGGRLGVAVAGTPGGEVLARRGARLDRVGSLPLAPLASGEAGVLFGSFAAGRAALQDLLALGVDPDTRPRSPRDLAAVAAAPHGGPVAFGALHPDGRLELLDGRLGPAGQLEGVGAGFALADLDGDGTAELVASLATPAAPDRLRVLRLAPTGRPAEGAERAGPPAFESPPVAGLILCGAAADLTGDGHDDALLAADASGPDGPATELWLLTADVREGP
jgi:hypothetical protein